MNIHEVKYDPNKVKLYLNGEQMDICLEPVLIPQLTCFTKRIVTVEVLKKSGCYEGIKDLVSLTSVVKLNKEEYKIIGAEDRELSFVMNLEKL